MTEDTPTRAFVIQYSPPWTTYGSGLIVVKHKQAKTGPWPEHDQTRVNLSSYISSYSYYFEFNT